MTERLLSILLALILLLSALPMTVSAADTKISNMHFGLYEPENAIPPTFVPLPLV